MANRAAPTVYGDAPVADGAVSEAARVVPVADGAVADAEADALVASEVALVVTEILLSRMKLFFAGARAVPKSC